MKFKKLFAVMCSILTFVSCFGVNAMEGSQEGDSNRPRQVLVITDMPKNKVLLQTEGVLNKGTEYEAPAIFVSKGENKAIAPIFSIEEIFDGETIKSECAGVLCRYADVSDDILFWLKDEDKEANNNFFSVFGTYSKGLNIPKDGRPPFFYLCGKYCDGDEKTRSTELVMKTNGKFYHCICNFGDMSLFLTVVDVCRAVKEIRGGFESVKGENYRSFIDDAEYAKATKPTEADKKNCNTKLLGVGIPAALLAVVGAAFGGKKHGEHVAKNKVPKKRKINKLDPPY